MKSLIAAMFSAMLLIVSGCQQEAAAPPAAAPAAAPAEDSGDKLQLEINADEGSIKFNKED